MTKEQQFNQEDKAIVRAMDNLEETKSKLREEILNLQLQNSILLNTMKEIAVPYPEDITPEQTEILCKYLIARAQEAIRNVEPVKAIDLTKPDLFEQMSDIVKTNVKNNYNLDL